MASGSPAISSPKVEDNGDEYDNLCGICFTPVDPVDNPRGQLNSCDHIFCSYCIRKWAESTNVCPHCKALFTRIFTWDHETNTELCTKVRRRKFWNFGDPSNLLSSQEDEDGDSDPETEWSEERLLRRSQQLTVQCELCHSGHNAARMIFCDRRECAFVAHLECLGLTNPPVTFLCPTCQSARGTPTVDAAPTVHANTPPPPRVAPRADVKATEARPAASVASPPAARRQAKVPMGRPALLDGRPSPPAAPAPTTQVRPTTAAARKPAVSRLPVVPEGPIDFATTPLTALTAARASTVQASDGVDSDYYFMVPQAHALSAFGELRRRQQELADMHQKHRDRRMAMVQKYQTVPPLAQVGSLRGHDAPSRKRPRSGHGQAGPSHTELVEQQLEHMESDLVNPQTRAALEEELAKEWARDMLPVLRRNRSIDTNRLRLDSNMDIIVDAPKTSQDYEYEERALWEQAMTNGRQLARQKLDARAAAIRQKRQDLVKAQVQRESAALAKLARIIALHRQRDMQSAKNGAL